MTTTDAPLPVPVIPAGAIVLVEDGELVDVLRQDDRQGSQDRHGQPRVEDNDAER